MSMQKLVDCLVKGDWAGAESLLAPLAVAPDADPSLIYNWGKVLIELDRVDEAVAALARAVDAMPEHGNAWFELGRAAVIVEDLETAYDAFATALALDPADTDAQRNLGRLALRLGRYEVAREAWAALDGDPEAALALYRVAAETGDPGAAALRSDLLENHPDRTAAFTTLVRTSKGAIPLDLRNRTVGSD